MMHSEDHLTELPRTSFERFDLSFVTVTLPTHSHCVYHEVITDSSVKAARLEKTTWVGGVDVVDHSLGVFGYSGWFSY